jgi:hypothetical protein
MAGVLSAAVLSAVLAVPAQAQEAGTPVLPAEPVAAADAPREQPEPERSSEAGPLADGELPALRSERSRTYARDGVLEARLFDTAVNFRDLDGAWRRIDNRLVGTGAGWRNAGNSYALALPTELGTQRGVRFSVGGGANAAWVESSLQGAAGRGAALGSSVTYAGALPGVDVVHEATNATAKESLLLDSLGAGGVFRYDVRTSPGVVPQLRDGGVLFRRAGVEVFRFLPPFAVDAAGVRTEQVHYELTDASSGGQRYLLTVTLDAEWLQAPARTWPVLLDPTASRPPGTQNTLTGGTAAATSSPDRLCVGQDAAAGGPMRALVSFSDVRSVVPSTAQVLNAEVGLYRDGRHRQRHGRGAHPGGEPGVQLRRVVEPRRHRSGLEHGRWGCDRPGWANSDGVGGQRLCDVRLDRHRRRLGAW